MHAVVFRHHQGKTREDGGCLHIELAFMVFPAGERGLYHYFSLLLSNFILGLYIFFFLFVLTKVMCANVFFGGFLVRALRRRIYHHPLIYGQGEARQGSKDLFGVIYT